MLRIQISYLLLFSVLATWHVPFSIAAPRRNINLRAQLLARHLGPSRVSNKIGANDIMTVKKRLIPILSILEKSERTNGPTPQDLLTKAYHFRDDVGDYEASVTSSLLIANWQLARHLGLFNEEGEFSDQINSWQDSGKKIEIEHVVLPKEMPKFSTHLANVRLIEPSKKRGIKAEMNARDVSYKARLASIEKEISGRAEMNKIEKPQVLNSVGQTMDVAKKKFLQEMENAGEAAKGLPNIRVTGKMSASPSHKSKDRWRVSVETLNLSRHPTEVELEWYIVGITEKKNQYYIMAKGKVPMKMRKGQAAILEYYTGARRSYKTNADDMDGLDKNERKKSKVKFRGYILRVNHEKGVVETAASDSRLLSYIVKDGANSISKLPDFSKGVKNEKAYQ